MHTNTANNIDEYIASQPATDVEKLQQIRKLIRSVAPEAMETISYQMPAFRFHGMLVGFANCKHHIGFYPWNGTTVAEFGEVLKGYETSKAAIQFPKSKPLPVSLIKKIVRSRMKDNLAQEKRKSVKKKNTSLH